MKTNPATRPAPCPAPRTSAGMTLVELMVGMAVGLFVATVAIATFVSTRTLNVVNVSTTRMTENVRLAMDLLHTDLRGSGFAGCWPVGQRNEEPALVLEGGTDGAFITQGASGMLGFVGTGTGFNPALPSVFNGLGTTGFPDTTAPLTDSDIVSMRVPADGVGLALIGVMATPDAAPQVKPNMSENLITRGDIVLVGNCETWDVFQVTEADPKATGSLRHAAGNGSARTNKSDNLSRSFRSDATAYRLQTRHYYVARSKVRDGTNSLWRLEASGPMKAGTLNGLAAVEIANGIDKIKLEYGVDTLTASGSPPKAIDRYVAASAVTDWNRVISVRVLMTASTPDNVALAGGANRRVRTDVTEVVALRNIAP